MRVSILKVTSLLMVVFVFMLTPLCIADNGSNPASSAEAKIIEGLQKYIEDRAKLEMMFYFMSEMSRNFDKETTLRFLFPNTHRLLLQIEENFSGLIDENIWKEAFRADLEELPSNIYKITVLNNSDFLALLPRFSDAPNVFKWLKKHMIDKGLKNQYKVKDLLIAIGINQADVIKLEKIHLEKDLVKLSIKSQCLEKCDSRQKEKNIQCHLECVEKLLVYHHNLIKLPKILASLNLHNNYPNIETELNNLKTHLSWFSKFIKSDYVSIDPLAVSNFEIVAWEKEFLRNMGIDDDFTVKDFIGFLPDDGLNIAIKRIANIENSNQLECSTITGVNQKPNMLRFCQLAENPTTIKPTDLNPVDPFYQEIKSLLNSNFLEQSLWKITQSNSCLNGCAGDQDERRRELCKLRCKIAVSVNKSAFQKLMSILIRTHALDPERKTARVFSQIEIIISLAHKLRNREPLKTVIEYLITNSAFLDIKGKDFENLKRFDQLISEKLNSDKPLDFLTIATKDSKWLKLPDNSALEDFKNKVLPWYQALKSIQSKSFSVKQSDQLEYQIASFEYLVRLVTQLGFNGYSGDLELVIELQRLASKNEYRKMMVKIMQYYQERHQDKIDTDQFKMIALASSVAEAEDSDDIALAFKNTLAPVGSYKRKAIRGNGFTINAYAGLMAGREHYYTIKDTNSGLKTLTGLWVPIGVEYYFKYKWDFGLFISFLDLGVACQAASPEPNENESNKLTENETGTLKETKQEYGLQQMISPGLHIRFPSIKNSPFVLTVGMQYKPNLRRFVYKDANGNEKEILPASTQTFISLSIDMPLWFFE